MRQNLIYIFSITIIALTILWQYNASLETQDQSDKNNAEKVRSIKVVTTTAHIADLVKNIAGDTANVTSIMKNDVDPHLYRPLRSDIAQITQADVVFYNGQHLEGQMVEFFDQLKEQKPVFGIAYEIRHLITDDDGAYDPHIWMNVKNWSDASTIVSNRLSSLYPEHKETFQHNALEYINQLKMLDQDIKSSIKTIPENQRTLITAHDAFGYYGEAYNINVYGIQGISTSSEAGLKQINDVVKTIVNNKVPAIFLETSVSDKNIKAVIEGAKALGHKVVIGGKLYSDSLGKPGTTEGTYIGMMKHNTNSIVTSLGGVLPHHW